MLVSESEKFLAKKEGKIMDLVNDLENDFVLAMIVKKKHAEKINSKELLPLLSKIREILEPISAKDHSQRNSLPIIGEISLPVLSEAANSH